MAAGLAQLPGVEVEPVPIRTDIVFFRLTRLDIDAPTLVKRLDEQGVRMLDLDPTRVRAVTNYHVTADDVQQILRVAGEILA